MSRTEGWPGGRSGSSFGTACEEVEHKAVALDVIEAAGVGYFTRILGCVLVTFSLLGWWLSGSRMPLRPDGISFREARALMR